jgi:mevalonate kinase
MEEVFLKAHGKLLLTGEYAVLDGARALAVPTRQGQTLQVTASDSNDLEWTSTDANGHDWFHAQFDPADNFALRTTNDDGVAHRLAQILQACRAHCPGFLAQMRIGAQARIAADFPLDWGLGSSSTLVALLARWSGANPYQLLEASFGGSGYDLACAFANGPIVYERPAQGFSEDRFREVPFAPAFADHLYFVYLGKKQDSRAGIQRYRALANNDNAALAQRISTLTDQLLASTDLAAFEDILLEHERLIAQTLQLDRAQGLYFHDWEGQIKSLGAWGGDFVLATSNRDAAATKAYFAARGFGVCISYGEMVL